MTASGSAATGNELTAGCVVCGPSNITLATSEELRATRAQLLAEAGLPEDELRRRGRAYELDLHLIGLLDEIDQIDYLLGE